MKPHQLFTILLLATVIFLSACSAAPTATQSAPPATAPTATKAGYPAPTAGKPAANTGKPTDYPAPVVQPAFAGYPAPDAGLKVTAADGSSKVVTGAALTALAKVKVNLDGGNVELRKLSDVLQAAGINTYTKVSANGSNGTLALTKDQVAQAYLDFTADGIILSVQGIAKDKWINGVQSLKID